jgi:mono/diheme cytochrome c family protein
MGSFRIAFIGIGIWLAAAPAAALADDVNIGDVGRGAYMAHLADCAACHTVDKQPPFSGGRPMNAATDYISPGFVYSTNITPDREAGIGAYTLEDFSRALRKGVAKDGHHLYPAMPYPSFSKMTDKDIADLYAYFMKGVAPVKTRPPETKLLVPFNQRWALMFWNLVFAPHSVWQPDKDHDDLWNRGAYIVEGPAHCGACHTPRNVFYEERGYDHTSKLFVEGGILEHWFAPSLREEKFTGLGQWSESDIITFLKTGHNTRSTAFGEMDEAIEDGLQYTSGNDLHAIANYLKTLSASNESGAYMPKTASHAWTPGAGIYAQYCSSCHGQEGRGKPGYPALTGNPAVLMPHPAGLVQLILYGGHTAKTVMVPHTVAMPAFEKKLSDDEIADVLSYIRNNWGNKAAPFTTYDAKNLRLTITKEQQQLSTP